MLTAAIVSSDASSAAQLLACLQQTGLVSTSIRQWILPGAKLPEGGETVADIVLLDLAREPEPYFAFGTQLRRMRPSMRLIACSATNPPNHQVLLDAMRCGVQDFVSKPVTPEALRDILARFNQEGPAGGRAMQKLIVVMGSKGGVGTTTVAVNLGVQLCAHAQKRAVLLDFARPLGTAHLLLDLHPRFGIRDAIDSLDRLDSHFFAGLLERHKSKLEILGGAMQPEEWQNIPTTPLERVVNVAQAEFDVVLADLGSYFSSDLSPILRSARMILMVAEANVPSLWTLQRRLLALTGFGVEAERIRLVVNRWHKGDDEPLKSIEKETKHLVFACLPNDFRKASAAMNLGMPLMENHNNVLTDQYRQLADQLAGNSRGLVPKRGGGLSNFFTFTGKK
jgi:pilus assembly protein CpaE